MSKLQCDCRLRNGTKHKGEEKNVHVLVVTVTLTAGCKQRCFVTHMTQIVYILFTHRQLPAKFSVGWPARVVGGDTPWLNNT